jgi:hypothetical protein
MPCATGLTLTLTVLIVESLIEYEAVVVADGGG